MILRRRRMWRLNRRSMANPVLAWNRAHARLDQVGAQKYKIVFRAPGVDAENLSRIRQLRKKRRHAVQPQLPIVAYRRKDIWPILRPAETRNGRMPSSLRRPLL